MRINQTLTLTKSLKELPRRSLKLQRAMMLGSILSSELWPHWSDHCSSRWPARFCGTSAICLFCPSFTLTTGLSSSRIYPA